MIPIPGLSRPTTLDFHFKQSYIYFSDSQTYKIQLAKVLGDSVVTEDFITEGLNKVETTKDKKYSSEIDLIIFSGRRSCCWLGWAEPLLVWWRIAGYLCNYAAETFRPENSDKRKHEPPAIHCPWSAKRITFLVKLEQYWGSLWELWLYQLELIGWIRKTCGISLKVALA